MKKQKKYYDPKDKRMETKSQMRKEGELKTHGPYLGKKGMRGMK